MEVWKDVKGYEGLYQVSNLGNVRRLFKTAEPKLMNPNKGIRGGYYRVNLSKSKGKKIDVKTKYVHVLVVQSFLNQDYLKNNYQCNHINGNKADNSLINLEIVTKSENEKHAFKLGLKNLKGENHNRSKLTFSQVENIRINLSLGMPVKNIADYYKVSTSTIYNIKNRRRWDY